MTKKQLLNCMFIDMEVSVKQEFATLGTQLELEQAITKEVVKRVVGGPKKELKVIFTKLEHQSSSLEIKILGPYTT